MRPTVVAAVASVLVLGVAIAVQAQTAPAVPTGLFAVCGIHSRVALSHTDSASYPSVDPQFAVAGVTSDFSAFYQDYIAGLGCNTLGVDIALPCDPEPTANALANLCTWADGLSVSKPYLLVTFSGLATQADPAAATASAGAMVTVLTAKLTAAAQTQAYPRIVAYRLAPALNQLALTSATPLADACATAGALRTAIQGAEQAAFGETAAVTPLVCDFSVDQALLARGALTGTTLTPELADQTFTQASECLQAARAAGVADVFGLEWLPGTLSAGGVDDVAGLVRRLLAAFPDQALLLADTGFSTAFDTRQGQSDYCLGLLAALAAEAPNAPGLIGLCWSADLDGTSPEAPDPQAAQRVAAWDPAAAATGVAAAVSGGATDPDTAWWLDRSIANLGLIGFSPEGALELKPAASGMRALATAGLAVGETEAPAPPAPPGDTPTEPGADTAPPTPADVAVARISVAEGTLAPGQTATLAAQLSNSGATDATGVRVDFSWATQGSEDWQYVSDQSVVVDVPAGGKVEARAAPWTVPEGAAAVGVAAWREGVTEANDQDNALVANLTDLAAGPVAAAWALATSGGGNLLHQIGGAVLGQFKTMLQERKSQLAEKLIGAVGGYLLEAGNFLDKGVSGLLGNLLGGPLGAEPQTGGGTAPASQPGRPDLAIAALELASGSLTPGSTVVLRTRVRNLSAATAAPAATVDFSYVADGMTEWAFVNPAGLSLAATPGQEVSIATQAWTVPDGLQQLGVAVYLPDGPDADQSNDSLATTPAELAGGVVANAAVGETGETAPPPAPATTDGPADLSVAAIGLATGSLTAGQSVVLRATVANASAGEVTDAAVDFSYLLEGGTEWQYVADAPVPVTLPASGTLPVPAPAWTVPANLSAIGVVVWRQTGVDPVGDNNSLVASAADLLAGSVAANSAEANPGEGGGGTATATGPMVIQRPTVAKAGRLVEFTIEAPATRGRSLKGAAYLKVNGQTVDTETLATSAQTKTLSATLQWTPAEAGDYQVELAIPGAGRKPVQMTVTVQAGSRFERLPGLLKTPALQRAAVAAALPPGAAMKTAAGRGAPGAAVLGTALNHAARGALVASAGAGGGALPPAPKPMSHTTTTRFPTSVLAGLPAAPGPITATSHTMTSPLPSNGRRLPTGAATGLVTRPPATGGAATGGTGHPTTRLPAAPPSVATRLPSIGGTTTGAGGTTGTTPGGAGTGTTATRRLPTTPGGALTTTPGGTGRAPLGGATTRPTTPVLPNLSGSTPTSPAPTNSRLPVITPGTTTRLPSLGGAAVQASPLTLQLPTGSLVSGRATAINCVVREGAAPITSVSFLLGFPSNLVKLGAPDLRGTRPGQLGWRLTTRQMATGLLVTLSGTQPLTGTGKLLSFTVTSVSGQPASVTLALSQTAINGTSATIPTTGGALQLQLGR